MGPVSIECLCFKTMSWPCYDLVLPNSTSGLAKALNLSRPSQHGPMPICMVFTFWDHARAMIGQYQDHVQLSFTYGPARSLKLSRLRQHGIRPVSMECLLFGTMSSHDCTMLDLTTSNPSGALKFTRVSQCGLKPMCMNCNFWDNTRNHVRTMFGLALLQDQLELRKFHDLLNMV